MFYVMNVCLQHVWNTTLVSVILKDISVPLLATLLCGVCNWSSVCTGILIIVACNMNELTGLPP